MEEHARKDRGKEHRESPIQRGERREREKQRNNH